MGKQEETEAFSNPNTGARSSSAPVNSSDDFKTRGVNRLRNFSELSDRNSKASVRGVISGDGNAYGRD